MSRARLVITAVVVEGRGVREVARAYEVSPGWVSRLVARYREEGEAAFEAHSRRPLRSPKATSPEVVERIVELRQRLVASGDDEKTGGATAGYIHKARYASLRRPGVWCIRVSWPWLSPGPSVRAKGLRPRTIRWRVLLRGPANPDQQPRSNQSR
jgi:hypothetical protein